MINKPEAETIMEAIVSRHLNGVDDDISDLAVLKVTKDQLRATLVGNVNQDYITKTMAKKLFKVSPVPEYVLEPNGMLIHDTALLSRRSPTESSKASRRTRSGGDTGRRLFDRLPFDRTVGLCFTSSTSTGLQAQRRRRGPRARGMRVQRRDGRVSLSEKGCVATVVGRR
jgi:hypothetical protein